ncbi:TonB-dependent receptor [Aquabacterium sp. CECT 9606]|uniref:TonB-dependent receptor n=1 Tax=Aquabacterium sp. CECT 9606 TaxID=2845822 RepID=UPI001E5EF335|nr:TonB-dependent receptor [Aquabacterium sp. CECT 9606]CAH0354089.1 putative TonB-dependent receptor [Aquabacterium sp. CECT 9606]
MQLQRTLLASAVLSALASISFAQTAEPQQAALPTVTVTATPFGASEGAQILAPAKVLSGDELNRKMGASLGDTLSHELGVSASAFGAGASRPIIRGLEGSRVKILQNGMDVSDVSGLSNDHGVTIDGPTARQIEILRGPAALLYGSGAIGGLVNVVNDRIPTVLEPEPTGEAELRYGTVDKSGTASVSATGSTGAIGLHVDGSARGASDYNIPDDQRLPWSYARQHSLGVGASYIQDWGHVGASVGQVESRYGIPTQEGAQIDQKQTRYDLDTLVKNPFASFETFKFKLGYTDYKHAELDLASVPETYFANRGLESRWELTHAPVAGWHGTFGVQTEENQFSALSADGGAPDTVPVTKSTSAAGFLVEERDLGPVRMNAGLRYENVKRRPVTGEDRSFGLTSYSVGGLWPFTPGYGLGLTASVAERAPATEELYSNGPHDATGTFDIGNASFKKETSHNFELSLQKTHGLVRWKANLFENHVKDFIYGQITGNTVDEDGLPGGNLRERVFGQADAVIRGAEAEVSYNQRGSGLSWRGFADTSSGSLKDGGSLPLQPATRFGADIGYRQGPWRTGASVIHAQSQDRLAASETPTPSYTQLDANLAYVQRVGNNEVTWFLLAKNLLNEDIRLSTSVLKDVAPLPGRNFIVGVRTQF